MVGANLARDKADNGARPHRANAAEKQGDTPFVVWRQSMRRLKFVRLPRTEAAGSERKLGNFDRGSSPTDHKVCPR